MTPWHGFCTPVTRQVAQQASLRAGLGGKNHGARAKSTDYLFPPPNPQIQIRSVALARLFAGPAVTRQVANWQASVPAGPCKRQGAKTPSAIFPYPANMEIIN